MNRSLRSVRRVASPTGTRAASSIGAQAWIVLALGALSVACEAPSGDDCALSPTPQVFDVDPVPVGDDVPVQVSVAADSGACVITDVVLDPPDDGPFSLLGADGLALPIVVRAGAPWEGALVRFAPVDLETHSATVHLSLQSGASATQTLTVRGQGLAHAEWVHPTQIDFGLVEIGATGTAALTLDAPMEGELVLEDLRFTSEDGITVTSELATTSVLPRTMVPMTTSEIELLFRPLTTAPMHATLSVVIAGGQVLQTVDLVGNQPGATPAP